MRQLLLSLVFILLVVAFCHESSFAQFDEYGRWKTGLYYEPVQINYRSYSESDFTNVLTRLEAIKSDSSGLMDEWAGDYSAQSGEVNVIKLRWSSQAGFVLLNFYSCLPELRGLDFGTVTATPDYILLTYQTSRRSGRSARNGESVIT